MHVIRRGLLKICCRALPVLLLPLPALAGLGLVPVSYEQAGACRMRGGGCMSYAEQHAWASACLRCTT